jgi:hypothetical protein
MVQAQASKTRSRGGRAADRFRADVLDQVAKDLEALMQEVEAAGVGPEALGTPAEVARRMVATIPQPSPWAKVLGPVYTTGGVRELLGGITRQAVDDRINRGTLFAVTTADRRRVFPAYQFDDRNGPLEGLAEVVAPLRPLADEWMIASWLTQPAGELDGRSPVDWLRERRDRDRLDSFTRVTVSRWAR